MESTVPVPEIQAQYFNFLFNELSGLHCVVFQRKGEKRLKS